MFIVHHNGYPVVIKMGRGSKPIAFKSLAEGQAYLKWKGLPAALGTLKEILALNPRAFPQQFDILYLPSRQVIDLLVKEPEHFPGDEFLVSLTHNVTPPPENLTPPSPVKDPNQDEFLF